MAIYSHSAYKQDCSPVQAFDRAALRYRGSRADVNFPHECRTVKRQKQGQNIPKSKVKVEIEPRTGLRSKAPKAEIKDMDIEEGGRAHTSLTLSTCTFFYCSKIDFGLKPILMNSLALKKTSCWLCMAEWSYISQHALMSIYLHGQWLCPYRWVSLIFLELIEAFCGLPGFGRQILWDMQIPPIC